MRSFSDTMGREWIANAREEETPRHHGRWFMTFQLASAVSPAEFALPEIQWQNRGTAERTIRTMSEGELRRRLEVARARAPRVENEVSTAATK